MQYHFTESSVGKKHADITSRSRRVVCHGGIRTASICICCAGGVPSSFLLILQLSFVFPSFGLFYIAVVEAHEKRIPIVPVLLQVPYLLLHVLAILLRVPWICESACNAFSSCSSMFSLLRLPLGAVTSGSRRRLLPGGSGASSAMPTLSHKRLIVCSSLQSRAPRSSGKS